jgi:16S rRNA (cytidine1402-2'-O)-methyltransferase
MPGKLILCGTPIGNLSDASARLQTALAGADLIYAEDTRRAATLLRALDVRTPVRSYFVGNEDRRSEELVTRLVAGETVALITDAGMPSVADPGLSAVQSAMAAAAEVTVVPGPSAVTAALAVSGLSAERFVFEGFLPRKGKDRAQRIRDIATEQRTVVLFSAKSRVVSDIDDLVEAMGSGRQIVVTRELTKVFEEVWRGTLGEASAHWSAENVRGEFTLVIDGATEEHADFDHVVAMARSAIESGESMADAVRRTASEFGISRRELYEAVLRDMS